MLEETKDRIYLNALHAVREKGPFKVSSYSVSRHRDRVEVIRLIYQAGGMDPYDWMHLCFRVHKRLNYVQLRECLQAVDPELSKDEFKKYWRWARYKNWLLTDDSENVIKPMAPVIWSSKQFYDDHSYIAMIEDDPLILTKHDPEKAVKAALALYDLPTT